VGMAKAKKSSAARASKFFSFRAADGLIILFVGAVGALTMFLYQDIRKDIDMLVHNQHVLKTQLVPKIGEEIDNVRTSIREINSRLAVKKAAPQAPAVKGKRHASNEAGQEPTTEELFNDILNKYSILNSSLSRSIGGRFPAQVNGEENGKTLGWVISQIGMCVSWLLVIGAIVILILKMIEQGPGRNDP
jgi:hypothetical protein